MEKVHKVSWVQISYTIIRTLKSSTFQGIFRCRKMEPNLLNMVYVSAVVFSCGQKLHYWKFSEGRCIVMIHIQSMICFVVLFFVLFFFPLPFSPKSDAVNIPCLKRRRTWAWFWLLVLIVTIIRDFSNGNIHDMLCYRKMFLNAERWLRLD